MKILIKMKSSMFATSLISFLFIISMADLSKCEQMNKGMDKYLPDRWRAVYPQFQTPQIEIQLLKGHVSQDGRIVGSIEYLFSNNDKQSSNNYDETEENIDKVEPKEKKKGSEQNESKTLRPKTIFDIPKFESSCPEGQKKDRAGNCRDIFQLE